MKFRVIHPLNSSMSHKKSIDVNSWSFVLTVVDTSHWSGREQGNHWEFQGSPKNIRYLGSRVYYSVIKLIHWPYSICTGDTTLLLLIGQIDTAKHGRQWMSAPGHICQLFGRYSKVRKDSQDPHDCKLAETIFWVEYSWVVNNNIVIVSDNTLLSILFIGRIQWNSFRVMFGSYSLYASIVSVYHLSCYLFRSHFRLWLSRRYGGFPCATQQS
jgi:hypothetical protein